jgi:hypothetical protein
MFRFQRRILYAPAVALALLAPLASLTLLASCGESALDLDDLTPTEREFVTRFVVLERARAVALAEPAVGTALLDSLAAVWGDSANAAARVQVPSDPARAAAVYDLLGRILVAESDSLVHAPLARRLPAPLPHGAQLTPAAPTPPAEDR